MNSNVRGQAQQEQKRHFLVLSEASVRFVIGKISLASSLKCSVLIQRCYNEISCISDILVPSICGFYRTTQLC